MKKAIIISLILAAASLIATLILISVYQVTWQDLSRPNQEPTVLQRQEDMVLTTQKELVIETCGTRVELVEPAELAGSVNTLQVAEDSQYYLLKDTAPTMLLATTSSEVRISNCDVYRAQQEQRWLNFGLDTEGQRELKISWPANYNWEKITLLNYQGEGEIIGTVTAPVIEIENRSGWLTLPETIASTQQMTINNRSGRLTLLQVQAPQLKLTNNSGGLTITELMSDQVEAEQRSGSVEINKGQVRQSLKLINNSGSTEIGAVAAGLIEVENHSGYMNFEQTQGQFMIENNSGTVDLEDCQIAPNSEVLKNHSGQVKIDGGTGELIKRQKSAAPRVIEIAPDEIEDLENYFDKN